MKSFALALVASLVALPACKPRQFNSSQTLQAVSNPDDPEGPCTETLMPGAPYAPSELRGALVAGLNQGGTGGVFQEEHFRDFLFSDQASAAKQGRLTEDSLGLGNDCALTREINKSMRQPSFFYWLTGNGRTSFGGMVLYRGDVFAEGFYRNRSNGVQGSFFKRKAYSPAEIFTQQPWLEWNAATKRFVAHVGGAGEQLLRRATADQGGGSVELHRGINVKYARRENALATLGNFRFGEYGAFFTTPIFESAKGWANPVVLSARFPAESLLEAFTRPIPGRSNLPAVYAGIEYDYVEIAFLYTAGESSNLFFDGLFRTCVVPEKASNPDDRNFAPPCPGTRLL